MASATSDLPDPTDELDEVFHALSDRTRRAILVRLADHPATVTDLAEPFAMSLPAVSKHLKVLARARLVSQTVDGRLHRCSLDTTALRTADEWLAPYREFWGDRFEALDRHLRATERVGSRTLRRIRSRPKR
ncbi:MAG: metalloregulator ArsR/SmtB family transcription factor, partial [Thermoplasmata archaeon]|nr:metalloregulator ArsR/SmtB family transcription factor [Thermoplasmata archaeon]